MLRLPDLLWPLLLLLFLLRRFLLDFELFLIRPLGERDRDRDLGDIRLTGDFEKGD